MVSVIASTPALMVAWARERTGASDYPALAHRRSPQRRRASDHGAHGEERARHASSQKFRKILAGGRYRHLLLGLRAKGLLEDRGGPAGDSLVIHNGMSIQRQFDLGWRRACNRGHAIGGAANAIQYLRAHTFVHASDRCHARTA